MFFTGENLWAKRAQNVWGKFGQIRAKILHIPKTLLAPRPMSDLRDFLSVKSLIFFVVLYLSS